MRHWIETCGVGPFFVLEHVPMEALTYRGQPVKLDFSMALAQAGGMQIELVQQHCDTPSVYRDSVPKGQSAFHHLALFAKDFDRELAAYQARGCGAVQTGKFGSMRVAYIDARHETQCVIELLEESQPVRDHFRMIADAAASWNGGNPIRPAF